MKCLQICFFTLLFFCISSTVNAGIPPEQVKLIQQRLLELGFDAGPVDGILGPKTIGAVKQFQTSRKIPVTAKPDDKTVAALGLSLTPGGGREPTGKKSKTKASRRQSSDGNGILLSIPFRWYFIAGVILTVLAFISVRRIERTNRRRGWRYFIAKNSLEFLIPFVAVCAFYSMLAVSLSVSSNYMSLATLISFENLLLKIKSIVDIFNLDPLMVLLILVLLFILGLLRVGSPRIETASSALERYQKITRRVYTVIVLLCAFTLLGTYAGVPAENFKVRIKTLRDGYADLVQDIERMVKDAAMDEIVKNAKARLPDAYAGALTNALTVEDQLAGLKTYYRSQKEKWHIDIAAVDAIISQKTPKPKVIVFKAGGRSTIDVHQRNQKKPGQTVCGKIPAFRAAGRCGSKFSPR